MISRIRTRRSLLNRAGEAIGAAIDRHPALPLIVVLVALYFVNS